MLYFSDVKHSMEKNLIKNGRGGPTGKPKELPM
jgi:hypothetical protein